MKQDLLLLHGALGTKSQFKDLKAQLLPKFNLHDLDFAGHGTNSSTEDFTMHLFTENAIAYLNAKNIEKVNIFGYSMGGYVALNMASKYPDRVSKIITLGTKFAWTKETAEKEIKMLNPEKIEEKVPAFANKLASLHTANDWKEVVNKTAKMMLGLGSGKKLSLQDLEQIQHQVLIGIGSEDKMVSIEESTESANALASGKLKIIQGFQHPIEKVNVEELASIIEHCLSSTISK